MSSDPCVELCTAVACCCVMSEVAGSVGDIGRTDRTVGIALGCILGLATIAACVTLAHTSSTVFNRYSWTYEVVSNTRYIPAAAVAGGLLTLIAFSSSARGY